jgi:hypothetical protein
MAEEKSPERPSGRPALGTFLRRFLWRREVGPLSAEAGLDVRELDAAPEPLPRRDPGSAAP